MAYKYQGHWGSVFNALRKGGNNAFTAGGLLGDDYQWNDSPYQVNPYDFAHRYDSRNIRGPFSLYDNSFENGHEYRETPSFMEDNDTSVAPGSPIGKKESSGVSALKNIGYGAAILNGINQWNDKSYLNASKNYDAMAQTARNNAQIVQQQNLQTGIAGSNEANAMRERGDRMEGTARANYGASGVSANYGSALDVQSGIAGRTEADARTIQQNTLMKQWALSAEQNQYEAQAQNYQNQARQYKAAYKQNRRMALLNTAIAAAKIYYGVGV